LTPGPAEAILGIWVGWVQPPSQVIIIRGHLEVISSTLPPYAIAGMLDLVLWSGALMLLWISRHLGKSDAVARPDTTAR
jgi:hypothetical protein